MFIVPVPRRAYANPRNFDRLFDDAFDRLLRQPAASDAAPVRRPALDVSEADAGYVVTLDIPGVTREDVKVSVDGRQVSVVAAAREPETPAQADAQPQQPATRVVLRERAAASFARSFTLPSEIDQASSQARLENGVLTLTLAKRGPSAAQLTVN